MRLRNILIASMALSVLMAFSLMGAERGGRGERRPGGAGGAGGAGAGGGAPGAAAAARGERGGFFGGGMFGDMGGGVFGRDALREFIIVLADVNLAPDFSLSKEQKDQIQAIRDAYRKQQEKWRSDHEADIQKLRERFRDAMRQGGGGRDAFAELNKAREELMATAPKADDAIKQIKAVLTEDQLKRVETRQAELRAEAERMREQMRERFNRGGGQGGGGAGGGARGNQ